MDWLPGSVTQTLLKPTTEESLAVVPQPRWTQNSDLQRGSLEMKKELVNDRFDNCSFKGKTNNLW